MGELQKKEKDKTIHRIFLGLSLVLGLIWLNTFIRQNSFTEGIGSFTFFNKFLITALCTIFFYWLIEGQVASETLRVTTKLCAVGTAISSILMLFALLVEFGTENFSLYREKEVILLGLSISKSYIYDIWAIIIFPANISVIFKAMQKEHFDLEALFYGGIAILGLTLEGCLIFQPMSNIWLVDLMILNTITIVLAIWKYAVPVKQIRKRNMVIAVLLYSIMRILLLPILCVSGDGTFVSFMYEGDWSDLISGINELVRNAALFGTSDYLLKSEYIQWWLINRNKPVLQLLYYGGWVSVIGFILFLMVFLIVLVKLLGIKNAREHRNWLIFGTAVTMLSIRIVMGLLYNFGFTYPISLPFFGKYGSVMDSMAFTLILIAAWENYKINRFLKTESSFVLPEDVLGIQNNYCITDEFGQLYTEGIYEDKVNIVGSKEIVHCKANWYRVRKRKFCIFEKKSMKTGSQKFILEYADEKWKSLENSDDDLRKIIIEEYMYRNRPLFMVDDEEEYEYEEEDDYFERRANNRSSSNM